jgi:ABC-type oligopeptide transport system substrate-binding subunit
MSVETHYQSVVHATWVNNKRKPLDDPRVRRAMHLVLDRPVLMEVVKDVAPMMVGGFLYPFSEFATPKEERDKRLGYQSDSEAAIKEARALMAAAGHPDGIKGLDFMVREVAIFKLWSQAIQAMLKQALNIECNLRTVVESVWFGDAASGNFDLAIGAIVSALLDPSDYFNAWYGKDGPQNYSFWDNEEFQALSAQIDREIDAEKRQDLIRRAEAIMEQDPSLLPVASERIHRVLGRLAGFPTADCFQPRTLAKLRREEVPLWVDRAVPSTVARRAACGATSSSGRVPAKDGFPPIAGGRGCDPRTRQSNLSELIIDYRLS